MGDFLVRAKHWVLNAWDDASAFVQKHQFWAGFVAGLAASIIVRVLL